MKTTAPPYLPTLTPLRDMAALVLVMFHANLMMAPFVDPTQTKFIGTSWLWVDFFFVLSGFVLRYSGARFARIYPLHFVTLLVAAGLALVINSKATGMSDFCKTIFGLHIIPASLLFLQSLHLFGTSPLCSTGCFFRTDGCFNLPVCRSSGPELLQSTIQTPQTR